MAPLVDNIMLRFSTHIWLQNNCITISMMIGARYVIKYFVNYCVESAHDTLYQKMLTESDIKDVKYEMITNTLC